MPIFKIIAGALLLGLGRKIYWLFVAATGFAAGLALAGRFFQDQPTWVMLVIGLLFGIVGAALAGFFQKAAIGVAGFAAGALIVDALIKGAGGSASGFMLVLVIIGGIIGAVLVSVAFDWALILLSSAAGALLIVQGFAFDGALQMLALAGLFILGLGLQFGLMRREKHGE